jgi:hypothetical protein
VLGDPRTLRAEKDDDGQDEAALAPAGQNLKEPGQEEDEGHKEKDEADGFFLKYLKGLLTIFSREDPVIILKDHLKGLSGSLFIVDNQYVWFDLH